MKTVTRNGMTRRRTVVAGAIALAATTVLPNLPPLPLPGLRADAQELTRRLLRIFRDPAAAASIGRCYLQQQPHECDGERLLAGVLDGDANGTASAAMRDAATLHDRLRRRIRADFAAGRTVWVDGVLLAQTEARLYALAALA